MSLEEPARIVDDGAAACKALSGRPRIDGANHRLGSEAKRRVSILRKAARLGADWSVLRGPFLAPQDDGVAWSYPDADFLR